MTLRSPLFQQALTYSALEVRQLIPAVGDAGVCGSGDLAVSQRGAGANMTVDVSPGRCIIPGASGSYLCASDATVSVAIAAAPGVGNERIDVVYARLEDSEITGSNNRWTIGVVAGTAAGSPVAPALPSAYCIALAQVRLTSATTSVTNGIITNARRQAASPSDVVWPSMYAATLGNDQTSTTAEDWGSVVIPAPNRDVRVVCSVDGAFATVSPQTNVFGELALRVSYGATTLTPPGVSGLSTSFLDTIPISRTYTIICTPGIGEAITVTARIRAVISGDVEFSSGYLLAQVFPR